MSQYSVEIFRGPNHDRFESWPLAPIVAESLEPYVGQNVETAKVLIELHKLPSISPSTSLPLLENLCPEFGYAYVTVYSHNRVIYQHPHPVDELISAVVKRRLAKRVPDESYWSFRLDVPGMHSQPRNSFRPAPSVEGQHSFDSRDQNGPLFSIRRLPEEPLPQASLKDFDVKPSAKDRDAPVAVLIPDTIERNLIKERKLSTRWEEGGFLIGRVYQNSEMPDSWLVVLTDAPNAEHTGASLIEFTFTSDSFAAVKRVLSTRPGERIVGWFHTHLFPATASFGLSSIDYHLHFTTFTIPWQIAGLINLDGNDRTLRFYHRKDRKMLLCPVWRIGN